MGFPHPVERYVEHYGLAGVFISCQTDFGMLWTEVETMNQQRVNARSGNRKGGFRKSLDASAISFPRCFAPPMSRYPAFLSLLAIFALAGPAWAGTDMSSASYKIRRSDVNSGGSSQGSSANHKITGTVGTRGGSLFSGTTYFVYSGFANVVSHPNAIEYLATITGP